LLWGGTEGPFRERCFLNGPRAQFGVTYRIPSVIPGDKETGWTSPFTQQNKRVVGKLVAKNEEIQGEGDLGGSGPYEPDGFFLELTWAGSPKNVPSPEQRVVQA